MLVRGEAGTAPGHMTPFSVLAYLCPLVIRARQALWKSEGCPQGCVLLMRAGRDIGADLRVYWVHTCLMTSLDACLDIELPSSFCSVA